MLRSHDPRVAGPARCSIHWLALGLLALFSCREAQVADSGMPPSGERAPDASVASLPAAPGAVRFEVRSVDGGLLSSGSVYLTPILTPEEDRSELQLARQSRPSQMPPRSVPIAGGLAIAANLRPRDWLACASADGHLAECLHVNPSGTSSPVVVVLKSEFRVRGVVLGPEGRPIAHAEVEAEVLDESRPWGPRDRAETNAAGEFEIRKLPGPELRLRVMASGFVEQEEGTRAPVEPMTFRLAAGAPLEGVVVDKRGRGLRDTAVFVMPLSGRHAAKAEHWVISTDDKGAFLFSRLAPGTSVEVYAYEDGRESGHVRLVLGPDSGRAVRLVLP